MAYGKGVGGKRLGPKMGLTQFPTALLNLRVGGY